MRVSLNLILSNAESIIDCLDFANEMAQKVREVYGCAIMQE